MVRNPDDCLTHQRSIFSWTHGLAAEAFVQYLLFYQFFIARAIQYYIQL